MTFLEQVKERLFYVHAVRLRQIKYRISGSFIILSKICVAGLGAVDGDIFGIMR
jgi:hypothetical protein